MFEVAVAQRTAHPAGRFVHPRARRPAARRAMSLLAAESSGAASAAPLTFDVLEHAIAHWGYLAVVLGTALEGEAILLVAAAMAHRGLLSLPWVALSALAGSVVGDQMWFLVGQRAGRGFIAARPRLALRVGAVELWIARWGMLFVLSFRFLYGLRTISPVILGATGYPRMKFVLLNVAGGALWAISFALVGYGLGAALTAALGRAHRLEEVAVVSIGIACALVAIARRRARKVVAQPRDQAPRPPRSA